MISFHLGNFKLTQPTIDDPPQNRMGLQVTFLPIGTITPKAIYNEINFAPASFDTFFSLKYLWLEYEGVCFPM